MIHGASGRMGRALLRLAAGLPGWPYGTLIVASGLAWLLAFGLAGYHLGAVFIRPRRDGGQGCEEPLDAHGQEGTAPRCG